VLLWSAPSFGLRAGQQRMARLMAEQGIEVWQFDLADALFLPRGSGTMRQIEGKYVADLIEYAHAETGKQVLLTSSSYGAIPLLRGARAWQLRSPARPYLLGAMLFSPNLYSTIPPLGLEPEYEPIVDATNIPVYILQGSDNANRWQLPRLVSRLEAGGSHFGGDLCPSPAELLVVGLVVAVPAPGIQHVGAGSRLGVEDPGRSREALGPPLDRPPALLDDVSHHSALLVDQPSRSAIMRAAVALAELTTPGTPAPGWVPAPTKYSPPIFRSRLCTRNQAL